MANGGWADCSGGKSILVAKMGNRSGNVVGRSTSLFTLHSCNQISFYVINTHTHRYVCVTVCVCNNGEI